MQFDRGSSELRTLAQRVDWETSSNVDSRFVSVDITGKRRAFACTLIAGVLAYARPALATDGKDAPAPLPPEIEELFDARKREQGVALLAQCFPRKALARIRPDPQRQRDAEKRRKHQHQIRDLYENATALLGGEHALFSLGPVAYTQCDQPMDCDDSTWRGDLAAWAALPLWGLGGGHGSDWFPALETSARVDSDQSFALTLTLYARQVASLAEYDVPVEDLAVHVAEMRASVRALAEAGYQRDVQRYEFARSIVACLDYSQHANDTSESIDAERLLRYASGAVKMAGRVREHHRTAAGPDVAFTRAADQLCSVCGGEPLLKYAPREHLRQQVAQLNGLIEMLTQYIIPSTRHTLLAGPTFGVPLARDPLSAFYYGALIEVGGAISVTAGVLGAYDDFRFFEGVFVGVALSGVPADDLWHLLNGGRNASRDVEEASW